MLRVTAEDKDAADRFLNAVGDNLAYLLVVFKTYNKGHPGGGSLSLVAHMDKWGQGILTDLRFYYGIDLIETVRGRGMPPRLVLWHIERLPDTSLTAALQTGGWDHFGWGYDRHIAADLHDAINLQTEVTGHWEKDPPKLPRWPRPKSKQSR